MARAACARRRPHLEITAFINLIVVLVPFLLSTAVFSRLAVLDLNLPAQPAAPRQLKVDDLQLEVVICAPTRIEVGDRIGGLIQRIPNAAREHDCERCRTLMLQVKSRFPDKTASQRAGRARHPYDHGWCR
jgi:biopolymer transport protein ExbD